MVLRYSDKRVVLHAGMCVAGGEPRFRVHGTEGSLIKRGTDPQEAQSVAGLRPGDPQWGLDADPLMFIAPDGKIQETPAPKGSQEDFYAVMAAACRGEASPPISTQEMLDVQDVIEAAIISAREGRLVAL